MILRFPRPGWEASFCIGQAEEVMQPTKHGLLCISGASQVRATQPNTPHAAAARRTDEERVRELGEVEAGL